MNTHRQTGDARLLAGWTAIFCALCAWFNIYGFLTATHGDAGAMLHGATALGLEPGAQQWFRVSMLADIFGFYFAFLVLGGYLWTRLRVAGGAQADIALLCIVAYALFGAAGAAMQLAALAPLAVLHAAQDPALRAATESAWTALAHASQRGLWWLEGPLLAYWAAVMGPLLRRHGIPYGRLLMVCGALYGVAFIAEFTGARAPTELLQTVAVLLLPLWMLLTGIALLRQRSVQVAP